ncbi:hypothetical protein KR018_010315, partial [Drosophila ironensis]
KAKMFFKYLVEPTPQNIFRSRDSLQYFNGALLRLGWRLPSRTTQYWWIHYIWSVVSFIIIFIYLPHNEIMTGVKGFKNFSTSELFTFIQAPVNTNAFVLKAIIVFALRGRFTKALNLMDQMDTRCVKLEEKYLIHRSAVLANFVVVGFHAIYLSFQAMTVYGGVTAGKTPFCIYNPLFDAKENLYLAILTETIPAAGIIFGNLVLDVYAILYVIVMQGHLKALIERIKVLRSDSEKSDDQDYEELVACVKDHKLIVEFGNLLRPMISATMFVQLLSVGILLGLAAVSIQFFTTTSERLVSLAYGVAILTQTFPCCYFCDKLKSDCDSLSNSLFHSNWIDANRRYRTTMLYFIHNAQQSIVFTASGILPIDLSTNVKMAKFAFTVVTIVNEMDLAEKFN